MAEAGGGHHGGCDRCQRCVQCVPLGPRPHSQESTASQLEDGLVVLTDAVLQSEVCGVKRNIIRTVIRYTLHKQGPVHWHKVSRKHMHLVNSTFQIIRIKTADRQLRLALMNLTLYVT